MYGTIDREELESTANHFRELTMATVCVQLSFNDSTIAASDISDALERFQAKWHAVLQPFGGRLFVHRDGETRLLCGPEINISTRDGSAFSRAVLSFLSTISASDDGSDFSFGLEGFPVEFYRDLCELIEDGYDEDMPVNVHGVVTIPGWVNGYYSGNFILRPDGIERSFDLYEDMDEEEEEGEATSEDDK